MGIVLISRFLLSGNLPANDLVTCQLMKGANHVLYERVAVSIRDAAGCESQKDRLADVGVLSLRKKRCLNCLLCPWRSIRRPRRFLR